MAPNYNLLLPMKLDAFVFNEKVCNGEGPGKAKIAPITQPNYTFLQIEEVQADILEHVDIHASAPASKNPRYTDIGKATVRQNRLGVYIHWSLPRPLRSGVATTEKQDDKKDDKKNDKKDDKKDPSEKFDPSAPRYPAIPNRWLVIRHLDPSLNATLPSNSHGMKEFKAWIIESDKTRNIDDIPITADLEVDVSPFITSFFNKSAADIKTEEQAEVFIGSCVEAATWDAEEKPKPGEQRVALTAASSSNQLFIDYQYHCGNVFSMLDTFSFQDEHGKTCHLQSAVAHYYVIGWHNDPEKDIMGSWSGDETSRAAKLQKLRVDIDKEVPKDNKGDIEDWLNDAGNDAGSVRTLCHGAMYDVVWKADELPEKVPADEVASVMAKMPFSVGGTPMDAVLAYIGERDKSGVVEASIGALQTLHRAADDGVDAQIAADDEVQTSHFAHLDGGDHFFLPAQEGEKSGAPPSDEDQKSVRYMNCAQHLLDATNRRIKQLRWDMFSWWWKLMSDVDKSNDDKKAYEIQDEIEELEAMALYLADFISKQAVPAKKGVMEAFHQRTDPTLVVSNIEAGWPTDFNDVLRGRLDIQTVDSGASNPPSEACVDKVHKDMREAARLLVKEFLWFKNLNPKTTYASGVVPLYHDGKHPSKPVDDDTNPWRDRWNNSQAWFPLYVEWEAEYTHQPFEKWELGQRPARAAATGKTAYMLKDSIQMNDDSDKPKDSRTLSGRSLILPQPTSAMRIHVERLFANMPIGQLNSMIKLKDRKDLLKKLDEVAMLSLPLAGLTDHLTTRYQGSHVKPLVRQPGREPVVLQEAIELLPSPPLGRDKKVDLSVIKEESHLTPYGSLPALLDSYISGFKPVTHGEMRFTKINIIDKFGQVAHAIDPNGEESPPIYPSVSQEYSIDEADHDTPAPPSKREYIQLPLAINQPARLNAHFLVPDIDPGRISVSGSGWRPSTEFEKPIWGWVVVNYVNRGLQFFLPDGTFYREVRSTAGAIKWLPFAEPPTPSNNVQLDALIDSLVSRKERLDAFTTMIFLALGNSVPTPSAYSQFMNSLVGRPLVLANMGWSLELNTDSLKNESTLPNQKRENAPLDWGLLPGDGGSKKQYKFSLQLGDKDKNYDGLVGYFLSKSSDEPVDGDFDTTPGDLDVSKIYTHFADPSHASFLKPIDSNAYPKLKTFWLKPKEYPPIIKGKEVDVITNARKFEAERNAELAKHLYGALFDPFAPITGYSGILPPRTLQLPSWVWETALKQITTFFHAGPLLVAENVPAFNKEHQLKQDTYKDDVKKSVSGAQMRIPALRAADWAWLQPYDEPVEDGDDDGKKERTGPRSLDGGGEEPHKPEKKRQQVYMSIEIGGDAGTDEAPRWKKGPLTAVEGFMQLKEPVEQGNDKEPPK